MIVRLDKAGRDVAARRIDDAFPPLALKVWGDLDDLAAGHAHIGHARRGARAIDHKPAVAWLPGEPFATFVRGVEVLLTVDRDAFIGSGLHLFAQLMEHFFGMYVQINSFVQLKLICQRSGEVLVAGQRRSGEGPLL